MRESALEDSNANLARLLLDVLEAFEELRTDLQKRDTKVEQSKEVIKDLQDRLKTTIDILIQIEDDTAKSTNDISDLIELWNRYYFKEALEKIK